MTDRGIDSEANQECAAKVFKEHDIMENLWNSFIHNKYSAITQSAIDANEHEGDEDRHIAWRDFAEYNKRNSS